MPHTCARLPPTLSFPISNSNYVLRFCKLVRPALIHRKADQSTVPRVRSERRHPAEDAGAIDDLLLPDGCPRRGRRRRVFLASSRIAPFARNGDPRHATRALGMCFRSVAPLAKLHEGYGRALGSSA